MTTKRYLNLRRRTVGMAAILVACVPVGWAQQKGNSTAQSAAALQQQLAAMQPQTGVGTGQASSPNPSLRQPNGSVSSVPQGDDPLFTLGDSARTRRNDERQRRLQSDTQRLLSLANQLKSEVSASGAESMTPEMLRQMEEIEKLAKSVKERMRS